MKFVGHTRFSVYSFGRGDLRLSKDTSESEYREQLYSSERMEPRMQCFLDESLPMLDAGRRRGNHEIVHVVSYSPSLPEEYRARLEEAAARYDFLQLNEVHEPVNPLLPSEEIVRAASGWQPGERVRVGLYRLDDDDVLAADYFERMVPHLKAAETGWWVSFGLGVTALRSDGRYYFVREDYEPLSTPGLLCVTDLDEEGELHGAGQANHRKTDRHFPVLLDSRHISFFRPRHSRQDSLGKRKDTAVSFYRALTNLQELPKIGFEDVLEAFPVLREKLSAGMHGETPTFEGPLRVTAERQHFELPSSRGFAADFVSAEPLEENQVLIGLQLRAVGAKSLDDKSLRGSLRRRGVKRDKSLGFYLPLPPGPRGRPLQAIFDAPEGVELDGLTITTKKPKHSFRRVSLYPPLDINP